jgi:2-phosphosulfolactate phosphatase
MQVNKFDFVDGAKKAEGIAVIIDVFRAFSVACCAYSLGAKKVIPVASIEQALQVNEPGQKTVSVGERDGMKLPGFDFGNSPTALQNGDLKDAVIVQTTHAGTQGIANAMQAEEVVAGALVNAKATADYIKSKQPKQVSLVRMGYRANETTAEDDLCADYLEALLTDTPYDSGAIRSTLLNSPCAERFLDDSQPWSPMSDFDYCTQPDIFDFVLKLNRPPEQAPYLERININ